MQVKEHFYKKKIDLSISLLARILYRVDYLVQNTP